MFLSTRCQLESIADSFFLRPAQGISKFLPRSLVCAILRNARIERRPAEAGRMAEMWLGRHVGQVMEGFVDLVKALVLSVLGS